MRCEKHDKVHNVFSDGSTACSCCIEEIVRTREPYALRIWGSILQVLPPFEKEWLATACEYVSAMSGEAEEMVILRLIVSKALRSDCTVEDVLTDIQVKRSVSCILFT